MADSNASFLAIALSRSVRTRAARIAFVVGTLLALINHGDRLLSASVDMGTLLKILLTFLVPYGVSTYTSVLAVRDGRQTLSRGA